jgi:Spy/CpxP family protein refolding chaperone
MRKSILILLLGLAGLCGAASFGFSAPTTEPSGGYASGYTWRDGPLSHLIRAQFGRWMTLRNELDLTPAQKEQIHAILESHKAEIVQVMQPVVEKRRALRDAIASPNMDEQAIRAAADDLGHSLGDAAVLAAKIKNEISPILTDEQRQKLMDFRTQSDHSVDEFFQKVSAQ